MSKIATGSLLGLLAVVTVTWISRSVGKPAPKAEPPKAVLTPVRQAKGTWQRLFNSQNLDGWKHLGGGRCSVRDGLLVLENDAERRPGYLVSNVTAHDFRARVRCKVLQGDSGFFFRSCRHPRVPTEIMGPQVQLNTEPGRGLGGIFELHGRGWVRKVDPAVNTRLLESLDWIDCEIEVRGNRTQVAINGVRTITLEEEPPASPDANLIALQIHGGGYCQVLFAEIAVQVLN
jgi:hypothetical protein